MSLYIVILSVLVGLARKRSLRNLLDYPFRGLGWFFGALALQLFLGTSYAENLVTVRMLAPVLNLGSMGMLLWALWSNSELLGAKVAFAGVLPNLAVIFANGGKMPVSQEAAVAVGMPASRIAFLAAGRSMTHRLMRPDTSLRWFGDMLYFPPPAPRSPLFSIGDVILAAGLFLLVQDAMRGPVPAPGQPVRFPETPPPQVDTPGPGC